LIAFGALAFVVGVLTLGASPWPTILLGLAIAAAGFTRLGWVLARRQELRRTSR